ncbi:permease-like cell division protein FtsX [uncultured Ilyobacter sp.]|uniref:cell division protein FtsX n=1 Tax=uncultured Ilyobacter sp. TaxID=544433 RepID=UPI0029C71369|nr:permease-like cell division protein FtsX [uncultured Ilyobacter sp.]
MFNWLKLFLNEVDEIIDRDLRWYRMNFFNLIFAFIVLNAVGGVLLNLYQNTENLKDNYKVRIYLKGNPDEKSLNKFESKLLEMPEVVHMKYESKEVELRELEDDLGIRLPKGNNPLSDSISLTFDGYDKLELLRKNLDKEDSFIKEVYVDNDQLENLNKKIAQNETVMKYFFIGAFLPIVVIIFGLLHTNIVKHSRDISAKVYMGENKKIVLKPYYFISDAIFTGAAFTGTLIFLNIYEVFRREFINYDRDYILSSTEQMLVLAALTTLVIIVIFPFFSRKIYRIKGDNK